MGVYQKIHLVELTCIFPATLSGHRSSYASNICFGPVCESLFLCSNTNQTEYQFLPSFFVCFNPSDFLLITYNLLKVVHDHKDSNVSLAIKRADTSYSISHYYPFQISKCQSYTIFYKFAVLDFIYQFLTTEDKD